MPFTDRLDAGRRLAEALRPLATEHPVVLALPRGGVPVGWVVARRLGAPLDVLVARKLGAPGQPELAIGAIAAGAVYLDRDVIALLGVSDRYVEAVKAEEAHELERREREYRRGRPPVAVAGRTVILVDDGLATGATARAAIASLRGREARRVVFAVPVGAPESVAALRPDVDELVCLETPSRFRAVSLAYDDFTPTTDAEVREYLETAESPA
ncbi:MAG TPA: phosphoribosyltransferase family protein [Gemmatimonadales bacterium]|nr:phosphoribosyltransferase family protein [Gemmatimonadales bacterium]